MRNRTVTFRKIFLPAFIDALIEIYEMGADFVDITGSMNKVQDEIEIAVMEEYMGERDLSGEDINDLLDGEE